MSGVSSHQTAAFDIDAYLARSGALDLSAIDWAEVPRHPVAPETIRTLRYMQDIESHTIVYLRSLLATRTIDDPDVARFLACWVYEETFHGLALERFFCLVEQAHVLDRDRRLIGEGLEERDLLLGERTNLDAAQYDCA